nr:unnamed protein product [Spirometra erinaceieuropaei]
MRFQSRAPTDTIHELLSADDCALKDISEEGMQRSMDLLAAAYDNFGLIINTEKTMVMHQLPADAVYVAPQINVNGTQLQVMDNFAYLSRILSRKTKIDGEVACRSSIRRSAKHSLESTWSPP